MNETRLVSAVQFQTDSAGNTNGLSLPSGYPTGPFKTNGTVYASAYGIVSSLVADQTAAIVAMDAALALLAFGGEIIWPAGDICFTGPITITSGALSANFYSTNNTRKTPPTFIGASYGGTRFRMLNAATTNCAGFIFSITDAESTAGVTRVVAPAFENCDFYGPGTTLLQTTLNTQAVAADVSLSLVGALAAVGDAICLVNGAKKHWATVKTIAGAGPQTVTIDARQNILSTFATASTTVLLFKQTRLLQFGGTRTAGSTITQEARMKGCRFFSAFQGICIDDMTLMVMDMPVFQGVMHCISYGYNCDTINLNSPYWGSDQPLVTATCTNGSATITGTGIGDSMRVGSKVWEAGVLPTLYFPEHTYVKTVSANSVVLSEAYTGSTGSKSLTIAGTGTLIVNGIGETAFIGNCTDNTLNNFTATKVDNPVGGRVEALARCADTVGVGFSVHGGYIEVCQRVMTNGMAGGSGSGGVFLFDNFAIQGADSCLAAPFEEFLGGESKWDLRISSAGTPVFPLFQSATNNCHIRLAPGWNWPNSTAATAYGQVSPATVNLSGADNIGVAITAGQEWTYRCGADTSYLEGDKGATTVLTALNGNLNWNWPGITGLDITLAGSSQIAATIYGLPPKGYELSITLASGGAYNFTFPALGSGNGYFRLANSDATVGTIAGTPANLTRCTLKFKSDGLAMRLQGNQTPTWVLTAAA